MFIGIRGFESHSSRIFCYIILLFILNKFFDNYALLSLKAFISTYSRAWNPYFFNFILGSRNNLTILNPISIYTQIKRTFMFIRGVFFKAGKLMIINELNSSSIHQTSRYTMFKSWTPGILTNKLILKDKIKIHKLLFQVPSVALIFKPKLGNVSFLRESRNILLPNISFMDTHFNHQLADYAVLSNFNLGLSYYYTSILNNVDKDSYLNLSFNYLNFIKFNKVKLIFRKINKRNFYKYKHLFKQYKSIKLGLKFLTNSFRLTSYIIKLNNNTNKTKINIKRSKSYLKSYSLLESINENLRFNKYFKFVKPFFVRLYRSSIKYPFLRKRIYFYTRRLNKLVLRKLKKALVFKENSLCMPGRIIGKKNKLSIIKLIINSKFRPKLINYRYSNRKYKRFKSKKLFKKKR